MERAGHAVTSSAYEYQRERLTICGVAAHCRWRPLLARRTPKMGVAATALGRGLGLALGLRMAI